MVLFPCEERVKRVLPLIKKAIIEELHRRGYRVKDIARMLHMTPAAVSQYLHGKRGGSLPITPSSVKSIADLIISGRIRQEEICKVCDAVAERL